MKKRIALLLAAVLCVSLAACGEKGGETGADGSQEQPAASAASAASAQDADGTGGTEPQKQTIEITLDNWQEYFEFRPVVYEKKDSYNELTGMRVYYMFLPKEAIADNIVGVGEDDDRIVFDVQYIDPYACIYRYDLNTKKLTVGEFAEDSSPYRADDLLPSYDESGTYDSCIDPGYFPTDGYMVITFPLNKYMDCTVKDNIMESYGYAISSVEITRIKGTFTILK